MSSFAILRIQKLKAGVAVQRSLKHAFRTQDTPNADPARLAENSHIGATSIDEAMAKFRDRLPDKIRKNAVLAVEFLITASPEVMAQKSRADQDRYFADSLEWLKQRHGAENVVYAGIHRDETTPHMYAYVVPLDERGKLNCRSFYGGAEVLSKVQSDFADRVGKRHGLERGIEGSKARHTTVRQFYAGIEAEMRQPVLSPEAVIPRQVGRKLGMLPVNEAPEETAARITTAMHQRYAPIVAAAGVAKIERKKRQEAEATAKVQAAKLAEAAPILDLLHGLSARSREALLEQAAKLREIEQRTAQKAERWATLVREAAKQATSAVGKYAQRAVAALQAAGGKPESVDLKAMDNGYIADAIPKGGRATAVQVVVDYSPRFAGISPEKRTELLARDAAKAKAEQAKSRPEPARKPGPER